MMSAFSSSCAFSASDEEPVRRRALERPRVFSYIIVINSLSAKYVHAARSRTRFEAFEPIRQAVRTVFGGYAAGLAPGLALRHNHGSQVHERRLSGRVRFLGIASSPAFVRAPEGNGAPSVSFAC